MKLLSTASNAPEALLCGLWLWGVTKQASSGLFPRSSEALRPQIIPYCKAFRVPYNAHFARHSERSEESFLYVKLFPMWI
jgi:hypothetical protein